MYSEKVSKELDKKRVKIGDKIRITKDGKIYEGFLMPRIELGNPNSLVIKLKNGYNIGLDFDQDVTIERIEGNLELGVIPKVKIERNEKLPKISIIATGGTIGTHVDYKTGGVFMCRTPEEILSTSPEIGEIIDLKSTHTPFTLASEDISFKEWQKMADLVAKELNSGCRGVIITHGTDTLHYSSAALSFMLKNLSKPVAFVGAQRSPDRGSFDGSMNLICASHFVGHSDVGEVSLVMHGTPNDDYCLVNRGTRVRKFHTSRRDAFQSVNAKPLLKIWRDGKIEKIVNDYKKFEEKKVEVDNKFNEKVGLIKAHPNSDPSIIEWFIEKKYDGLVIEGTGLGHAPTNTLKGENSWLPYIKKAIDKGINVVMTSQTIFGRVHPYVYRNLRLVSELGVIYPEDMLSEVALIKLSWILGHTKNPEKIKEIMLTPIAGELNERNSLMDFAKIE